MSFTGTPSPVVGAAAGVSAPGGYWGFVLTTFLFGILVSFGFALLIIPGFLLGLAFGYAPLLLGVNLLGLLALGIGRVVTVPMSSLAMVYAFRRTQGRGSGDTAHGFSDSPCHLRARKI